MARSPIISAFFALSLCSIASGTAAQEAGAQPPDMLVSELQKGGLVLYIRHAQTERDYADQLTADPNVCSSQRVLSEEGWHQARAIGTAIAQLNIPVGDVIASQYCRAWQSADLAFGRYRKDAALNFEPAENYAPEQVAAMRDRVLPLLTAPIAAGTNLVVVGHDDPFEAVTGIYPEPQGVAFVLRQTADGVEVLGSIAPDQWPAP
jgi:broad specificity phosphatase PhoE